MRRTILAAVSIGLLITVVIFGNTAYNARKSNQPTEQQIQAKVIQSSPTEDGNDGAVLPPCGNDWIWYHNICFYFSETAGTWTDARDSCAELDSYLAMIDTREELDFMTFNKGNRDHWIGLERRVYDQRWIWVDGTEFNSWFTVGNDSRCAYLSHYIVRSSECYYKRKWICTKYPFKN